MSRKKNETRGRKKTTLNWKILCAIERGNTDKEIIRRLKCSARRLGKVKATMQNGYNIKQYA